MRNQSTPPAQLAPLQGRWQGLRLPAIPGHIWPAIIVAYAVLLPREFSISIAGAAFYPYRLALFGVLPFIVGSLFKHQLRLHPIDAVAGFVALWVVVALIANEPLLRALEAGLALSLDFGLAYLLGRVTLRRADDLRCLLVALLPGLIMVVAVLMAEALADRQILRPLVAELAGLPPPEVYDEERLGLYRATGPFPHPILGGVLLATLLPLVWFALDDWRLRMIGIVVASGMIFTVSSAAILAYLGCAGLIALYLAQRWSGLPLHLIAGVAALLMLGAIMVLSDSGLLSFFGRYLSLSPASGNWRILIWQYATAETLANPLFGIGLRDWSRPVWMYTDSIDAHFLLWSMRFGLPAGIGVLVVMLGSALLLLFNARFQTPRARLVSIGLAFTLLTIVFSGFTVTLLEGVGAWMLMLSGMAVSLGTPPRGLRKAQAPFPLRRRVERE